MISVYKYDERAIIPTRNFKHDAGADLYAIQDTFIPYGSTVKIKTGIAIEIPEGYVGKIEDRSSMGARGLKVSGGVIDAGYNGEITVIMNNLTNREFHTDYFSGYQVKTGDKVAQLLIYSVNTTGFMQVKDVWESPRGKNGLGSSGR